MKFEEMMKDARKAIPPDQRRIDKEGDGLHKILRMVETLEESGSMPDTDNTLRMVIIAQMQTLAWTLGIDIKSPLQSHVAAIRQGFKEADFPEELQEAVAKLQTDLVKDQLKRRIKRETVKETVDDILKESTAPKPDAKSAGA